METIVVGVDGSQGGRLALLAAAKEAQMRGGRLRVVSAWQIPTAAYGGGFYPGIDQASIDSFGESAEKIVQDALTEARAAQPGLHCEGVAIEGQAADVLLQQGQTASLLVVGNRGHGGFASLLLGSVSQQVVHHALCPVLVVRLPTDGKAHPA